MDDNFFLNLEKQQGSGITIKELAVNDKETTDQTHILEHIREFYKTLFKTREQKTAIEMKNFFGGVDISKLSEYQAKRYQEDLTEYNTILGKACKIKNLQLTMD